MTADWQDKTWGDIATLEYGKGLREYSGTSGQFPVFGTNGQIGWYKEALYEGPSVIVGRKGAYRGIQYSETPFFVIDTAFYLKPKITFDMKWAYYELLTRDINSMDSGSAIPSTNRDEFHSLHVRIPPLPEQRRIALILGTLDDKIENNRKTAKTLEAMAQAIFKSWFVDFDPVRAKMSGESRESIRKRLKVTPEILDLFPDRLVDSELGEIPEGWGVGVFGNLVDYLHDQENPFSYPEVTFHHFSIPAFDEGKVPKVELGNAIKSLKLLVPPNVVLLSKLNPETNRVWLVDVAKGNRAVCSTEFLVLRAKPPFTRSYIYLFAHSDFFREKIEGLVTGTSKSHQRAQAGSVSSIPAMLPAANVIDVFNSITDKMLLRTLIYRRELTDLIKIRDTLLPKLISGEIRVPEADHLIEQAT